MWLDNCVLYMQAVTDLAMNWIIFSCSPLLSVPGRAVE